MCFVLPRAYAAVLVGFFGTNAVLHNQEMYILSDLSSMGHNSLYSSIYLKLCKCLLYIGIQLNLRLKIYRGFLSLSNIYGTE